MFNVQCKCIKLFAEDNCLLKTIIFLCCQSHCIFVCLVFVRNLSCLQTNMPQGSSCTAPPPPRCLSANDFFPWLKHNFLVCWPWPELEDWRTPRLNKARLNQAIWRSNPQAIGWEIKIKIIIPDNCTVVPVFYDSF